MSKTQEIPARFQPGYLDHLDGRTSVAVEMRERFREFTDDLGGVEHLSYAARSLVERALWLEYWLRQQERQLADGAAFDAAKWTQAANSLQGILSKLGLERRSRDVGDLQSYLRSKEAAA